MSDESPLEPLTNYLCKVPAITGKISSGFLNDGRWWVKFTIDIRHPACVESCPRTRTVLNYVSLDERLPTVFIPVSPPPYMNGGPHEYLSWVIESKDKDFKPETCAEWLEGRLPRPVSEAARWNITEGN